MPRGGKRPGAGRPKGSKEPKTLEKEEARALLRRIVAANLTPMVEAQVAHAKGLKYLVTRDKAGGKFVKVTEAMAGALNGDEIIEVWEKEPSVQAFTDLLNRTIDKPVDQVNVDANVDAVLRWKGEK